MSQTFFSARRGNSQMAGRLSQAAINNRASQYLIHLERG